MHVKFSPGNSKMGNIPSVSLPSIETCPFCGCRDKCYAHKIERIRPTVKEAYKNNLNLLRNDEESYWREVEGQIMLNRYFRFHVSGDIPNESYLVHMVRVAERNPHCQILCFTKRYEWVNDYIDREKKPMPGNLHLVLSAWPGLKMVNPHKLPEAHVLFRDGSTTAAPNAKECSGNCAECAVTDRGCWTLKNGEQVKFHEH